MKKDEVQTMINDALENPTFLDKIKALFFPVKDPEIKNIILQDGTGTEIEFPDLEEGDTPKVGDKANVDSSAANGDYVMPDGITYTFENGELTAITEPVQDKNEAPDQPKNETIEALNSKIADQEKTIGDQSSSIQALQDELKQMKALITTDAGLGLKRELDDEGNIKNRTGYKPKGLFTNN